MWIILIFFQTIIILIVQDTLKLLIALLNLKLFILNLVWSHIEKKRLPEGGKTLFTSILLPTCTTMTYIEQYKMMFGHVIILKNTSSEVLRKIRREADFKIVFSILINKVIFLSVYVF